MIDKPTSQCNGRRELSFLEWRERQKSQPAYPTQRIVQMVQEINGVQEPHRSKRNFLFKCGPVGQYVSCVDVRGVNCNDKNQYT